MAPLRLALICALGIALLTPQAAAGGGWWSYLDVGPSIVAPGQRVEVNAAVAFDSAAAAEEAREPGRFSVHLLRGFDDTVLERAMRQAAPRNWWSLGGAEAIPVGQVAVSVAETGLGRASAAFTVPDLPPGTYHVMLCDAACTEPLADVIPTKGFTVVADPVTAQVAQRVDRLERRIRKQARQLAASRKGADRARITARNTRSEVERLEGRLSSVAGERRSSPRVGPWAYAGWLVAGALAGVLLVLRRSRRTTSARADADDVDQPEQPALERRLGPRRRLDADLEAPGPVPVGPLEVDGHDPAAAAAQQGQHADKDVVAIRGRDREPPWSGAGDMRGGSNRRDGGHD
jgi:hypothetical protein